jgi:DNA-directed RNA polymerase specialized sigma24 family protein
MSATSKPTAPNHLSNERLVVRRWSVTSERFRLTAHEREAIIARVEMGYSYEELAEALGRPTPEAARKAAHRALVRLAQEMDRAAERPAG